MNITELLKEETGLDFDPVKLAHEKELEFERRLDHVQPIAPVVALVHQHRGKLPIAVATGGIRRICETILEHIGLLGWFDAMVCAKRCRIINRPPTSSSKRPAGSASPPSNASSTKTPTRASKRREEPRCSGSTFARFTRREGLVGSRQ